MKDASLTPDAAPRFRRYLGPPPGSREARAISLFALAAGVILAALSLYAGLRGERFLGRSLGGDFAQFYVVGRILNEGGGAAIYDPLLQHRLYLSSVPAADPRRMFVYGSAPVLALLFRPFALLGYIPAYVSWLAFSLAVYLAALRLLWRAVDLPERQRRTATLLALGSPLYILETWIGGQVSVLAFLIVAAALYLLARRFEWRAGLALGLLAFKPTLCAVPLLMLVAGRRWRVLAGAAAGIAALALLSFLAVGAEGLRAWYATLAVYRTLALGPEATFRRFKYVDLNSFFQMLLAGWEGAAPVLALLAAGALLAWLARAWWRYSNLDPAGVRLLWSATLAAALLVNLYLPVYDALLLAACMALLAGARGGALTPWLVAFYLVPWLTQSFAEFLRLQLLTPLVAAYCVWAIRAAAYFAPNTAISTPPTIPRPGIATPGIS